MCSSIVSSGASFIYDSLTGDDDDEAYAVESTAVESEDVKAAESTSASSGSTTNVQKSLAKVWTRYDTATATAGSSTAKAEKLGG